MGDDNISAHVWVIFSILCSLEQIAVTEASGSEKKDPLIRCKPEAESRSSTTYDLVYEGMEHLEPNERSKRSLDWLKKFFKKSPGGNPATKLGTNTGAIFKFKEWLEKAKKKGGKKWLFGLAAALGIGSMALASKRPSSFRRGLPRGWATWRGVN